MKNSKLVSDSKLVRNYQSGDKNALQILVKRWHLRFCKYAFWIVKDTDVAKDIAQESWSTIMVRINDLQDVDKFKSWSISIVNRRSIDWIRAKNRENTKLIKYYNESFKVQDDEIIGNQELKSFVLKTINDLSENQQTIVKLFYSQNYTLKEISEILEISVGTVKSRLFHAREKLKTIFKNMNYEN